MLRSKLIGPHGLASPGGDLLRVFAAAGGAPVTFGAISQSTVDEDSSTTHSVSHTAVVGSNVAALALVVSQSTSTDPSGVTYGGAAMTQIGSTFVAVAGNLIRVSVWIKVSPATGAQTVEVTNPDPFKQYLAVMSFTGVHQTVPTSALFTATGTAATATVTATDVGANDLVVDFVANWGDAPTVDGSQTQRGTTADVGGTIMAQSTKAGSGSVPMSWSVSGDGWGTLAVVLKPAS